MNLPGQLPTLATTVGRAACRVLGLPPSAPLHRRIGTAVLVAAPVAALDVRIAVLVAGSLLAAGVVGDRRGRHGRHRSVVAELAEALPLLQLAAAGGLTVRAALGEVAPWLRGPLGAELRAAVDLSRAGSLADHLDGVADRLGPPVRPLTTALAAADRYGAPLEAPLAQLAVDVELAARRLDEEEARKVPVRLLLPLVVGVLPAFVLLTVLPLLAGALQAIRSPGP